METIASFGEFALIARLAQGITASAQRTDIAVGIGDDCAVLDLGSELLLLATTDSQVEGVHFTLSTATTEQIGRKALAVNLSDIAAMGGTPRYALVSLILPASTSLATLDGVYAGLRQEAECYATALVGGNIASAGTQLVIDITLLGAIERGHVLTRSGARPGDILCVTGTLGASAGGLQTLLQPDLPYAAQALEYVRMCHCTPQPRVQEGRVLSWFGPTVVTALLDISDGLSGDLAHLCESSNVGVRLESATIPLSPELCSIAKCIAHDPLDWALHGGEDYELLFSVAPDYVSSVIDAVQAATGTPVTQIGTICAAHDGLMLFGLDGGVAPLRVKSWDHLR
ncbi:MAG: thiamine-phosphate kinase [Chloroflexi bacterium]|nr:MAG: thiamine-phosphate kinase [Chloroflexota bacterium]